MLCRSSAPLAALLMLGACCEAAYGPGKCIEMNKQHQAMQHLVPHTVIAPMPDAYDLASAAPSAQMPESISASAMMNDTQKSAIHAATGNMLASHAQQIQQKQALTQMTAPPVSSSPAVHVAAAAGAVPFKRAPQAEIIDMPSTSAARNQQPWLRY